MNANNQNSCVFDSSMNSYSTGHVQFIQNGKPLDYSNTTDFELTPEKSKQLCANIEQFYSKIQLALLTQHLVQILSKCTNAQELAFLKQLSYTKNGKVLDYTNISDFENLDPTELAHLCGNIEEFYTEKITKIMELIYTYNTTLKPITNNTRLIGHKRKHWQIDGYYEETD